MLKKDITYVDYNGVERKETYYFNLSKPELIEMEYSGSGSYSEFAQTVVDARNNATILKVFKDLILKAYGEKSSDGRYLMKNPELSARFENSPAYESLYMELISDSEKAANFFTKILPADLQAEASKQATEKLSHV